MAQTWIVTASAQYGGLVELAREVAAPVTVVAVGDVPVPSSGVEPGIEKVLRVRLPQSRPVEALAPVVAGCVEAGPGDVVLVPDLPAERVLAGAIAAALGAPVATGVVRAEPPVVAHARYGGIVVEQTRTDRPVVLVVSGGTAVDGEAVDGGTADGAAVEGEGYDAVVSGTAQPETHAVDLGSARRIVAAGRGFKAEADLGLAHELADALGAEVACTRPLAEGQDWLPRDRYIGVSGQRVSPDLYVAVGVSGQLQHMSGVGGAKTIVAINSDPAAPVFDFADYGVVGDLYEVLPALAAALR
jgi:electron transfer flavoprotein alpha subunit